MYLTVLESLEATSSRLSMELQMGPGLLRPLLTLPIRQTLRTGYKNPQMSLGRLTALWQMVSLHT